MSSQDWTLLPPEALRIIFYSLDQEDFLNSICVCKKWYHEFLEGEKEFEEQEAEYGEEDQYEEENEADDGEPEPDENMETEPDENGGEQQPDEAMESEAVDDAAEGEVKMIDISKIKKEKVENRSAWCNLLPKALKTIASFLKSEELLNLKLVCKEWRESLEEDDNFEDYDELFEFPTVDLLSDEEEDEDKKKEEELLVTIIHRCRSEPTISKSEWSRIQKKIADWILKNKDKEPPRFEVLEKYKNFNIMKCANLYTKNLLSEIVLDYNNIWKGKTFELVSKAEIPRKDGFSYSEKQIDKLLVKSRKTIHRYCKENPFLMKFRDFCEISKAWEVIDRYEILQEKKVFYKEVGVEENPRKHPRKRPKKLVLTERQLDSVVDIYPRTRSVLFLVKKLKKKPFLNDRDYDAMKFAEEWLAYYKQKILDMTEDDIRKETEKMSAHSLKSAAGKNKNTSKEAGKKEVSKSSKPEEKKSSNQKVTGKDSKQKPSDAAKKADVKKPSEKEGVKKSTADKNSSNAAGKKTSEKAAEKNSSKAGDKKPSEKADDKKPSQKTGDKKPSEKTGDKKSLEKADDKKSSEKTGKSPLKKAEDKKTSEKAADGNKTSNNKTSSSKTDDKTPAVKSTNSKSSSKPEEKKSSGEKVSEKQLSSSKNSSSKPSSKIDDKKSSTSGDSSNKKSSDGKTQGKSASSKTVEAKSSHGKISEKHTTPRHTAKPYERGQTSSSRADRSKQHERRTADDHKSSTSRREEERRNTSASRATSKTSNTKGLREPADLVVDWKRGLPGKFWKRFALFLSKEDLCSCVRVCRRWNNSLQYKLNEKLKERNESLFLKRKLSRQIYEAKKRVIALIHRDISTLSDSQRLDLLNSRRLLERENLFDYDKFMELAKSETKRRLESLDQPGRNIKVLERSHTKDTDTDMRPDGPNPLQKRRKTLHNEPTMNTFQNQSQGQSFNGKDGIWVQGADNIPLVGAQMNQRQQNMHAPHMNQPQRDMPAQNNNGFDGGIFQKPRVDAMAAPINKKQFIPSNNNITIPLNSTVPDPDISLKSGSGFDLSRNSYLKVGVSKPLKIPPFIPSLLNTKMSFNNSMGPQGCNPPNFGNMDGPRNSFGGPANTNFNQPMNMGPQNMPFRNSIDVPNRNFDGMGGSSMRNCNQPFNRMDGPLNRNLDLDGRGFNPGLNMPIGRGLNDFDAPPICPPPPQISSQEFNMASDNAMLVDGPRRNEEIGGRNLNRQDFEMGGPNRDRDGPFNRNLNRQGLGGPMGPDFDGPRNVDRSDFGIEGRSDRDFDGPFNRNSNRPDFDGPRNANRPDFDGPRNVNRPDFDGPMRPDFDGPRNINRSDFEMRGPSDREFGGPFNRNLNRTDLDGPRRPDLDGPRIVNRPDFDDPRNDGPFNRNLNRQDLDGPMRQDFEGPRRGDFDAPRNRQEFEMGGPSDRDFGGPFNRNMNRSDVSRNLDRQDFDAPRGNRPGFGMDGRSDRDFDGPFNRNSDQLDFEGPRDRGFGPSNRDLDREFDGPRDRMVTNSGNPRNDESFWRGGNGETRNYQQPTENEREYRVAIVDANCRTGQIPFDKFQDIEIELKHTLRDQFPNTELNYRYMGVNRDVNWYWCKNEQSLDLLRKTISSMPPLWPKMNLKVVDTVNNRSRSPPLLNCPGSSMENIAEHKRRTQGFNVSFKTIKRYKGKPQLSSGEAARFRKATQFLEDKEVVEYALRAKYNDELAGRREAPY